MPSTISAMFPVAGALVEVGWGDSSRAADKGGESAGGVSEVDAGNRDALHELSWEDAVFADRMG